MSYLQPYLLGVGSLLLLFFLYSVKKRTRSLPLPPGPKPWPIIGNTLDLPKARDWEVYARWAKKYGDIIHLRTVNKTIIILNSHKAACDLLERKSSIYSDRPPSIMVRELLNFTGTGYQPYGHIWRKHRALFHKQMNANAVGSFESSQAEVAHELLLALLSTPNNSHRHIRTLAANLAMSIAYGRGLVHRFGNYVALSESNSGAFTSAIRPGAFLVEDVPLLKYVPAWFPGAGFQRFAQKGREGLMLARTVPFRDVKTELVSGNAQPSFVSNTLLDLGKSDETDEDVNTVKDVAGSIFTAGTDTTAGSLNWFILAMILYPEVQARAQKEIDSVVGRDRLPQFADRPDLPYMNAIVKEVLRWVPVTPLGLPHYLAVDDIYEGYRIPANSTIFVNSWHLLHDPEMYPDPLSFKPERFLPQGTEPMPRDPAINGAFGFGRRICAGRYFAEASIWIAATSMLSVFNIGNARNKDGTDIDVRYAFQPRPGFFSHPPPFPSSITPRSVEAEALVKQIVFNQ